jgi:hypothetical protein
MASQSKQRGDYQTYLEQKGEDRTLKREELTAKGDVAETLQQMRNDGAFRTQLLKMQGDAERAGDTNAAKLLATTNAALRNPDSWATLDPFLKQRTIELFDKFRPGARAQAPTTAANIPDAAVQLLKTNPKTRDQFDAMFGKGAAAHVLGE